MGKIALADGKSPVRIRTQMALMIDCQQLARRHHSHPGLPQLHAGGGQAPDVLVLLPAAPLRAALVITTTTKTKTALMKKKR